jgi:hypothetical protein
MVSRLTKQCFGSFPRLHYIPAPCNFNYGETESGLGAGEIPEFRGWFNVPRDRDGTETLLLAAPGDKWPDPAKWEKEKWPIFWDKEKWPDTPAWFKKLPCHENLSGTLFTRGVLYRPSHKSPPNYAERSHALLGRTVDTGRAYDVLSMVHAHYNQSSPLRLVGRGEEGIIAAYAAILEWTYLGDRNIKEVIIVDPPTSHRDGPIFLNVLRVLDIPEALGLLAPNVKLTLINAKDKAFDRTAQLYKLAGAEGKFQRE